ncbi:hypothetical protein [Streptomyces sp. NPDC005548]|uniref:hypothetical protein n=1 Tax=Streptomyces sp. NPDC005548 TaxID=3364724 RepID=UPI0036C876F8
MLAVIGTALLVFALAVALTHWLIGGSWMHSLSTGFTAVGVVMGGVAWRLLERFRARRARPQR